MAVAYRCCQLTDRLFLAGGGILKHFIYTHMKPFNVQWHSYAGNFQTHDCHYHFQVSPWFMQPCIKLQGIDTFSKHLRYLSSQYVSFKHIITEALSCEMCSCLNEWQ
jgi:hypothetical protein